MLPGMFISCLQSDGRLSGPWRQYAKGTYQTGICGRHTGMRSIPVGHDEALESKFLFQQTILRLAVLAAVASVDALVGAHDRGSACSHGIGKRPKVRFVHSLSNAIRRRGDDSPQKAG